MTGTSGPMKKTKKTTKTKTKIAPFWQTTDLGDMTREQWESLCDGCAKCCLVKLQDYDSDDVAYTDVACRLLDLDTCRCSDYPNRQRLVPNCVALSPANIAALYWMPSSCAYRLLAEGGDLPWWHPLVSGQAGTVRLAGVSAHNRVVSEAAVPTDALLNRIVTWPE